MNLHKLWAAIRYEVFPRFTPTASAKIRRWLLGIGLVILVNGALAIVIILLIRAGL